MSELIYRDESYNIIGACMKVHAKMKNGFLEAVYQEALEEEFRIRSIPFESQKKLVLYYGDKKLKKYYMADFLCYNKIILEIKAVDFVNYNMRDQLINYLKATKTRLGLLINFGKNSLEYKRILNSDPTIFK